MWYLCGGHSPYFVVVRSHKNVGNTNTSHAKNPIVKIGGFGVGYAMLKCGVNHAVQTLNLVFLGKHRNVVLEGIRDPKALVAYVGDALVFVPVFLSGKRLVYAIIEVLVMGENDMAANVIKLRGY